MSEDFDGRISEELQTQLRLQQVQGQLSETEAWLGMMVVLFGHRGAVGWHMRVRREHAELMRAEMPRGELAIQIGYDVESDMYTIDAI
jgi:hypothetical protein